MVRGEPGIGKTALLRYLMGEASGFRVVRGIGVESEMELPFAGLHQLCSPMLDRLGLVAEPQRRGLGVAFGLVPGENPDRFLVALAALSLLAETSEEQPLLCVVDDAQWLDQASAQVLGFVGRRLLAEPIALVFAARTAVTSPDHLVGLPELRLRGLDERPSRALLATVTPGPLDETSGHGSSGKHTAIPSPCSSSGGVSAPPSWPAGSRSRTRVTCPGAWRSSTRSACVNCLTIPSG